MKIKNYYANIINNDGQIDEDKMFDMLIKEFSKENKVNKFFDENNIKTDKEKRDFFKSITNMASTFCEEE